MKPPRLQLRYLRRLPLFSPRLWVRRVVYWVGALLVALMAIAFARGADAGQGIFHAIMGINRGLVFLVAPAGLALSVVLTRRFFPVHKAAAYRK